MRVETPQIVGLIGVGFIALGGFLGVVLPQSNLSWYGANVWAFPAIAIGSVLFLIGVVWGFFVWFARAVRVWDEERLRTPPELK